MSENIVLIIFKGLLRGFGKRQGKLIGPLSTARLFHDEQISGNELKLYEHNTIFQGGKAAASSSSQSSSPSHLSLCYPEVLTVGIAASLFVDRGFPLSPMGIIHTRQTIIQYAPIPKDGQYETQTWFSKHTVTEKGVEIVCSVLFFDKKTNTKLWEGETVVLSRAGGAGGKKKAPDTAFEVPKWDVQSTHIVKADTGLKYASVSGDYNPHHLYWWTAKPIGYNRPIAHGMWTLSAALHEVFALNAVDGTKYPQRVTCDFKKPLFMPSTITFGYKKKGENIVDFGVYDKNNVDPHIIANITVGQ